jgi:hypothetical protein
MRLKNDGVRLICLSGYCWPFPSFKSRVPLGASGSDIRQKLLRVTGTFRIVHRGQVVLRWLLLRWIQQVVFATNRQAERQVTKALGALAVWVGHPQWVIVQRVAYGVNHRFVGLNQRLPLLVLFCCHLLT